MTYTADGRRFCIFGFSNRTERFYNQDIPRQHSLFKGWVGMRSYAAKFSFVLGLVVVTGISLMPECAYSKEETLPVYLQDRGSGIPTSMFGTYVRKGEFLLYPFFEFYLNSDEEYSPAELGFVLDEDFRGKYKAYEGLLFVGYGITDWLAIELEAAIISASLETASGDPTAIPDKIEESGLGDVEGQLRMRWNRETERRPEVFSYFEAVAPVQKEKVLIGTPDWEFKFGSGIVKGFSWGTMTLRVAAEYSLDESKLDLGEYALEYLKRLTPHWRVYLGVEGTQDELELITEAQLHISNSLFIKLNNAFGISSKASDWAPEIGIMFPFSAN